MGGEGALKSPWGYVDLQTFKILYNPAAESVVPPAGGI